MDYFDDETQPDDNTRSELDITAISAAAFDGDHYALALLEELAESGALDAIEYAELIEDEFEGNDGD